MAENLQKIKPTIENMQIGDSVSFPILKMRSVRAQASEIGCILNRRYKTTTSREDRTITVIRLA